MIPFTFPSQPSVVSGNAECKVWYLSSVVGMARWIDYIPVREVATSPTIEGRTDAGGYQPVTLVSSISGLAAWTDYIPVYEDSSASVAWGTGADGYIPVGAAGAALSLQMLGGSLDPRITFTRASSGTYFGSDGLLKTASTNVARFDYDPVTMLPRGLLIEEQRTNLLLHSRDMTQATWFKTDTTPTRNQVGLDGVSNTACLMTDGSAGNALVYANGTIVDGSANTASVCLKRGNNDFVLVQYGDTTTGDYARVWLNTSTGVLSAPTIGGATTGVSSSVETLGGGWYRVKLTATLGAGDVSGRLTIIATSASGVTTRVSGATYILDCAQLEVGAFATSIITTGAATATRAADVASMTGSNFSSWFNANEGTFVVEYQTGQYSTIPIPVGIASAANASGFNTNAAGLARFWNGVTNMSTANSVAVGLLRKEAAGYAASARDICLNGGAVVSDANVPWSTARDRLTFGSNVGGSNQLCGHLRSLRYYNTRLPNATLQSLTA